MLAGNWKNVGGKAAVNQIPAFPTFAWAPAGEQTRMPRFSSKPRQTTGRMPRKEVSAMAAAAEGTMTAAAEGAISADNPYVQTVKAALVAMDAPASDQDVQAAASDEAVKAASAKVQELDLRLAKADEDLAAKDAKLQELDERIAAYDARLRQLVRHIAKEKKEKKDREARNKKLNSKKKVSFQ